MRPCEACQEPQHLSLPLIYQIILATLAATLCERIWLRWCRHFLLQHLWSFKCQIKFLPSSYCPLQAIRLVFDVSKEGAGTKVAIVARLKSKDCRSFSSKVKGSTAKAFCLHLHLLFTLLGTVSSCRTDRSLVQSFIFFSFPIRACGILWFIWHRTPAAVEIDYCFSL